MLIVFKKANIIIIIFLALTLLVTACDQPKEGIVAKVGEEEITNEEFNDEYDLFENIYIKQFGEDAMSQTGEDGRALEDILKEQILDKMIFEKIIEKETNSMDISVSDEELDEKIEEYIVMTGGEEEFNEFLESSDITREYFSGNLKKEILVNKHRKQFIDKIEVEEEDAREFFDENKEQLEVIKASHILVKTEEQAQMVLDKIADGDDFSELAKDLSVDKASSLLGGDLGYFTKGTRIPEFEEVAFGLEKGQISEIVKTEVGYHIIKLVDKKDSFDELKDEMIMILKEDEYKQEKDRLREEAKVIIY